MSFAMNLYNSSEERVYWIAVQQDDTGQWCAFTAEGRVDSKEAVAVITEKIYTGGRSGVFAGENNAIAYSKAIVRAKEEKGYKVTWLETGHDAYPRPAGTIPNWFERYCGGTAAVPTEKAEKKPRKVVVKTNPEEEVHDATKVRPALYGWQKRDGE